MGKRSTYQITVDGIPVDVTKKNVKHLRIVAYPSSGEVRISSPLNVPEHEIKMFANSRAGWIKKHLFNPEIKRRDKNPSFKNGTTHYVWGEPHRLIVKTGGDAYTVRVNDSREILLTIPDEGTIEEREPVMREWYRRIIKARIPGLIGKWEPVMHVKVFDWGVKKMKTRWGTCNTQAKRIWLNLELAKRNPKILEYIVVHEMTHLLERPHSRRFYRLMDRFLPEWRQSDREIGGKHWNKR